MTIRQKFATFAAATAITFGVFMACRRALPGGPTDPPSPPTITIVTPPPTAQKPFPVRIIGNRFEPPILAYFTCCTSSTEPEDEGIVEGWELITPARAREVAEHGVNLVGIRTGPYDGTDYQKITDTVISNRSLRIMTEVDLVDGWRLVHRNGSPPYGCDVVNGPVPEPLRAHIKAVVQATQPAADSVIFHVGNEISRCHPPDAWYLEVAAIAKQSGAHIVGGDAEIAGLDYFTYHGFYLEHPHSVPVLLNESDNEHHGADAWELLIGSGYETNGQVNIGFWPGPANTPTRNEVLDRIKKISDGKSVAECETPSSCPSHTTPGLGVHHCDTPENCVLNYTPKFAGRPCNNEHNRICGCSGEDRPPYDPTWRRCEDPRGGDWTNATPMGNPFLARARVGETVRVCAQPDSRDAEGKPVGGVAQSCREIVVKYLASPSIEEQE